MVIFYHVFYLQIFRNYHLVFTGKEIEESEADPPQEKKKKREIAAKRQEKIFLIFIS